MPEGLTQTKTPTSKNPAGFKSECRPVSFRNRGRLQIGTMAGFKSEYPAGINRNPQGIDASGGGAVFDRDCDSRNMGAVEASNGGRSSCQTGQAEGFRA